MKLRNRLWIVAATMVVVLSAGAPNAGAWDERQGACCLPAGTCLVLPEGLCDHLGGAYQGDETECAQVTCPVICEGDIVPDGEVNCRDLLAVLAAWGECEWVSCAADLTGDGAVNVDDLLIVLAAWGPCE